MQGSWPLARPRRLLEVNLREMPAGTPVITSPVAAGEAEAVGHTTIRAVGDEGEGLNKGHKAVPAIEHENWAMRRENVVVPTMSGGGGIRTHGGLATTTVFETVRFVRSRTPPIAPSCSRAWFLRAVPGHTKRQWYRHDAAAGPPQRAPRRSRRSPRCPQRRAAKKRARRSPASSARTPAVTGSSWLRRGSWQSW